MALILNIDTAVETASVCLAKDGEVLRLLINENQKDHASWLHVAILETLQDTGYKMPDVQAVAVSIGPGSFTGLRIGLSTAKGLCYAQHIPLIAVGTLEMMAFAAKDEAIDLLCPLIDARRMEVFAAVYNKTLQQIVPPSVMIVDDKSFAELLSSNKILFSGNGRKKLQTLITNNNASFSNTIGNASHLASLSHNRFRNNEFADLAYSQPLYLKEFYSTAHKPLQ